MTLRRKILSAFFGGELDPLLDGRIDAEQYDVGLATCENWIPLNEGPLVKRQGFEYIRPAAASASWLSAFRRSIEAEYAIEWSELKARFYTLGGRIETDADTPYEIATPYPAAQAPFLSLQQSFDRLYINHPDHPPAALLRNTTLTFTHEIQGLIDGPFLDTNSNEAVAVSANAATGVVTLTATGGAVFKSGHAGALFRIEARDFAAIRAWEPGMKDIAPGNQCRNEGRVYQALTGGTTGSVPPTHSDGDAWDGLEKKDLLNDKGPYGVQWRYLHDRFGIVRISSVASGTVASGTVQRRLPDTLTSAPSHKWAHQAFSEAEGWPSLVVLFRGRAVHFKGNDVLGTVAGDFAAGRFNFAAFTDTGVPEADLAFRRTLTFEDEPLWVTADRRMLVGTAAQELAIGPVNGGQAFSGTNIDAEIQSYYGSEPIFPVKVGTQTIFAERGGRRVRAADYDFGKDRYDAPDLTAAARHITRAGILQLAYQRIPHALVCGVRGDGQVIVHPVNRGNIKGWARIVPGGGAKALSAVAIVGADGKTDDLWLLVERVNGAGATVREVWKQARWRELGDAQSEAFYVDGGRRIAATAGQTVFGGLQHLAGQAVAVLAGGAVITGQAVAADGTLTLENQQVPDHPYTLVVGLPYTATATTMRPELRDGRASNQGLRQRLVRVVTRVLETLGLAVSVPGGPPEELILRSGADAMDRVIPLGNGDFGGEVEAEWDREGRASWTSADPVPAVVTLAALNIDISEGDE